MYNSIISQAIRKNNAVAYESHTVTKTLSVGGGAETAGSSYGRGPTPLMKRGGTSNSKNGDGRVTVGLSTSSSMRSHDQGTTMPHLIPQKTNVLTGAATKYFAD